MSDPKPILIQRSSLVLPDGVVASSSGVTSSPRQVSFQKYAKGRNGKRGYGGDDYSDDDDWDEEDDETSSISRTWTTSTFAKSKYSLAIHSGDKEKDGKEARKFGLFTLVAILFSQVVGSGVLTTPQYVYQYTGNANLALIVWFTYGLLALMGALCYIELGTTFPHGGGDYAYLNEAFGSLPAFLYQWAATFVFLPAVNAVMGLVAAEYLIAPYIASSNCPTAQCAIRMIATCFITVLSYVNCFDPKITNRFNGFLTISKFCIIGSVIACGIYYAVVNGFYHNEDFAIRHSPDKETKQSDYSVTNFIRAVGQVGFAYNGFSRLNYLTDDIINPRKNFPLGMLITMPLIIALYVVMNLMYFVTLDKKSLLSTKAIADDMFKAIIPLDQQAYTTWIAPTFIGVSIVTTMSIRVLTCAKVSFVGARNHHCPAFVGLVDRNYSSPIASIIIQAIASCIWAVAGDIPINIGLAFFTEACFSLAVIYAMIYLRIKQPQMSRPFKLPLALPIFYALVMTALFIAPFFCIDAASLVRTVSVMGGSIGVIITGIPMYYMCVKKGPRWEWVQKLHVGTTILTQKTLNLVPEETHTD